MHAHSIHYVVHVPSISCATHQDPRSQNVTQLALFNNSIVLLSVALRSELIATMKQHTTAMPSAMH